MKSQKKKKQQQQLALVARTAALCTLITDFGFVNSSANSALTPDAAS